MALFPRAVSVDRGPQEDGRAHDKPLEGDDPLCQALGCSSCRSALASRCTERTVGRCLVLDAHKAGGAVLGDPTPNPPLATLIALLRRSLGTIGAQERLTDRLGDPTLLDLGLVRRVVVLHRVRSGGVQVNNRFCVLRCSNSATLLLPVFAPTTTLVHPVNAMASPFTVMLCTTPDDLQRCLDIRVVSPPPRALSPPLPLTPSHPARSKCS